MRVSDGTSCKLITMRHEEKFICSERELNVFAHRLQPFMYSDSHQSGDSYHIRSLYFDTIDDRMYGESLDGVDKRSKYRIRFYNMRDDFFRLERKDTIGRLKQKQSVIVDKMDVERILCDKEHVPGDWQDKQGVLQEGYALCQTDGLRPVAIVDYTRMAFVYPIGNVRITFDCDISCTFRVGDLMDPNAVLYPVLPAGKHILEVKYDGILPGFLSSLLNMGNLQQTSFSKYTYSRITIDNNGIIG